MESDAPTAIRHLYVHVPYCHRICPYCSFYKHTPGRANFGGFVEALLAELRAKAGRFALPIETIYLGGGTPSLLPRRELTRLLTGIAEALPERDIAEWTIEMNPRTFDRAKAEAIRAAGVTRASLGVQSWDPATLATLGRDHSPGEAEDAYAELRAAGFPSVSLDLMFSVPGQAAAQWEADLRRTAALQPDHISAYNLNYEEDTEFFDRLTCGEYREDADADADLFLAAESILGGAGFAHYEISNYAQPGHESAHNRAYWRGEDYLGIGPGAFPPRGSDRDRARGSRSWHRWRNIEDTAEYIRRALAGIDPANEAEPIDRAAFRCSGSPSSCAPAKGSASMSSAGKARR
ncbi:MAG: radical SAM family heme chaperone HemW [Verrucomicrobiales bacterium]